jgi:predicted NAD/FAD-binding protein
MSDVQPKKVALVGSGIAGLSCAWLLSNDGYEVHIFEKAKRLGMDAFALEMGDGMRMDVPLRVFSRTYYPNLTTLYDRVGVKFTNADYSFSCSLGTMRSEQAVYFRYANYYDMRFAMPSLSGVYRSFSRCFKYCKLLFEIAYFFYFGAKHLKDGVMKDTTFGEYLERERYSEEFITELVVPMLAIVCTCSYGAVKNYPAGRYRYLFVMYDDYVY